jgi:hypothetical protein
MAYQLTRETLCSCHRKIHPKKKQNIYPTIPAARAAKELVRPAPSWAKNVAPASVVSTHTRPLGSVRAGCQKVGGRRRAQPGWVRKTDPVQKRAWHHHLLFDEIGRHLAEARTPGGDKNWPRRQRPGAKRTRWPMVTELWMALMCRAAITSRSSWRSNRSDGPSRSGPCSVPGRIDSHKVEKSADSIQKRLAGRPRLGKGARCIFLKDPFPRATGNCHRDISVFVTHHRPGCVPQ